MALTDLSIAFTAPFIKDASHVSWTKRTPSQTRLFSTETSLPFELSKLTNAFRSVGDDSLRHKQLLYMAGQLPKMDPKKMIPENKVPGCLSTVYIDGSNRWDEEKGDYVIDFVGDSDGLLTKGLVALLVRGLSGSTAAEIQAVPPEFIQDAQIGQSLTPGRNNGFLNMLSVMKQKARILRDTIATTTTNSNNNEKDDDDVLETEITDDHRPMYHGIIAALQVLRPTKLKLMDNSHQHAGHAGSKGYKGESHFELEIVAEAFEGLNLVKRHKLIYMLLGDIMPKIHALQISAKTPEEIV